MTTNNAAQAIQENARVSKEAAVSIAAKEAGLRVYDDVCCHALGFPFCASDTRLLSPGERGEWFIVHDCLCPACREAFLKIQGKKTISHPAPEMFAIGSAKWPGLSKLAEEAGEVMQVIDGAPGDGDRRRGLVEEIGDVLAACDYVGLANGIHAEICEESVRARSQPVGIVRSAGGVVQVIGKLMGTGGQVDHWDGTNLRLRLIEEVGKLRSACECFGALHGLGVGIAVRRSQKLPLFLRWHQEQACGAGG